MYQIKKLMPPGIQRNTKKKNDFGTKLPSFLHCKIGLLGPKDQNCNNKYLYLNTSTIYNSISFFFA